MPLELNTTLFKSFRQHLPAVTQIPDESILVYEESLLHVGAGRHCLLSESDDTQHDLNPGRLAEAARSLLPDTTTEQSLALFLPAHEFVATRVHMPGVAADKLYNAVRLQQPMLLPGLNVPLLLAVGSRHDAQHDCLALWFSSTRADALYQSFFAQGLFLSAILPRSLAAFTNENEARAIEDIDRCTRVFAAGHADNLQHWLYVTAKDYEQDAFRAQYEQQRDKAAANALVLADIDAWERCPAPSPAVFRYAARPQGAEREQQQRRQNKRWRTMRRVAFMAVLLIVAGGLALWLFKHQQESHLERLKAQTTDVSRLRAEILQIEEITGPVVKFPKVDVVDILTKLNTLLPMDSWVTALKISEGMVEIEGNSSEPTMLLEALVQEPGFADVAFSRPTQGRNFGISFRLVGFDVPAYIKEYFPSENL
jgi:hypothetical protein